MSTSSVSICQPGLTRIHLAEAPISDLGTPTSVPEVQDTEVTSAITPALKTVLSIGLVALVARYLV